MKWMKSRNTLLCSRAEKHVTRIFCIILRFVLKAVKMRGADGWLFGVFLSCALSIVMMDRRGVSIAFSALSNQLMSRWVFKFKIFINKGQTFDLSL